MTRIATTVRVRRAVPTIASTPTPTVPAAAIIPTLARQKVPVRGQIVHHAERLEQEATALMKSIAIDNDSIDRLTARVAEHEERLLKVMTSLGCTTRSVDDIVAERYTPTTRSSTVVDVKRLLYEVLGGDVDKLLPLVYVSVVEAKKALSARQLDLVSEKKIGALAQEKIRVIRNGSK